jgi:hypothetical protein
MAALKVADGGALVSVELQMLLEELQPRLVLLYNLRPCLDTNSNTISFVYQPAVLVGPAFNLSTGVGILSI